jgi:hypothetical protein
MNLVLIADVDSHDVELFEVFFEKILLLDLIVYDYWFFECLKSSVENIG